MQTSAMRNSGIGMNTLATRLDSSSHHLRIDATLPLHKAFI